MESKQHEWMTNDQEVNQHDIDNLDLGVGRTYQCVFCKRGFTTAQALGGHMNIHRKDRAKTTTTTRPTFNNKKDENYTAGPRFYQPITSYSPCYSTADQRAQIHYRNFLPTSSAHDDYHINLSNMQFGTAKFVEDMEAKMRGGVHDDGLDLELRLGHEP